MLIAGDELLDERRLEADDHLALNDLLAWFNEHLPVPTILKSEEHRRGLSWFKAAASEHIRRMWELKSVLDRAGVHVEVMRTTDPGVVIYEDDLQVVAKPRRR